MTSKGIQVRAHVVTPGRVQKLENATLDEFAIAGLDHKAVLEAALVRVPEAHRQALRGQLRAVVETPAGEYDDLTMAAVDDDYGYTWFRVVPIEVVS